MSAHARWSARLGAVVAAMFIAAGVLTFVAAPGERGPVQSAQASGYCSAACAIRKGNARIRRSYACTHLNYVCHVNVPVLDWLNGNWGWHGNVGRRCRRILTQEFSCQPIMSGGQIRKRDGAWVGFWWRIG